MNVIHSTTENDNTNKSILIVDDEPANTLLLKKILATRGYSNVMTTLDPTTVMSLQREHKFDLILLDINMPEMNGYEVIEQLRKTESLNDTQVIATSADIALRDPKNRTEAGFTGYITKPMKMQDLLDVIEQAFN